MKPTTQAKAALRSRQRGMSLIEIMVGVVIGLIGCVVIFQMYGAAEARKRTIASGSDMDISGRLGLMIVERDVQLAGYGFGTAASVSAGGVLGCDVNAYDDLRPGAKDFTFPLVPVLIQDGAAGAPDTLVTLRGNSSFVVSPKIIDISTASTKRIKADTGGRTGVQRGDVVIATDVDGGVSSCGMFEITGDANADELTFDHDTGAYTDAMLQPRVARYNKAGGVGYALTDEGSLYSLGPAPVRNVWSVQDNKLVVMNDLASTTGTPIEAADLIVDLQAQYGVDADNNGMIDSAEWTAVAPADWTRVLAVRFALLARSTQFERTKVTTTVPRWSGPDAFVMRNIDGTADSDPGGSSGDANNWRNYRYNVFEAVVPVRNTIIGKQL